MSRVTVELVRADDTFAEAAIRPMGSLDVSAWEKLWRPQLAKSSEPDRDWNWRTKYHASDTSDFERYVLECENQPQGFMILETKHRKSRSCSGNLIYVEYLAIAPWNRKSICDPRRFRPVGSLLLHWAVWRSYELGFDHRVGLHSVRDAGTEEFYRSKARMHDLGPDPEEGGLRYFEFDEASGRRYLLKLDA